MKGLGIHHPQGAIDFQRRGGELSLESLADHDLKDVAGANVLDASPNDLLEPRLREVRLKLKGVVSAEGDIRRLRRRRRLK